MNGYKIDGDTDFNSFVHGKQLLMIRWDCKSEDLSFELTQKIRALVGYVYERYAVHLKWFHAGNVVKMVVSKEDLHLLGVIKSYAINKALELKIPLEED